MIRVLWVSAVVFAAWAQTNFSGLPPMEAFAHRPGVHVAWSGEEGRISTEDARATVSALVLEDSAKPAHRMRGVRVDIVGPDGADRIDMDEAAAARTVQALIDISRGAAEVEEQGHGCVRTPEFQPFDHWPEKQYRELNVDYCVMPGSAGLRIVGRHSAFFAQFTSMKPERLTTLLQSALDRLKLH
jgi:hypothetical protein